MTVINALARGYDDNLVKGEWYELEELVSLGAQIREWKPSELTPDRRHSLRTQIGTLTDIGSDKESGYAPLFRQHRPKGPRRFLGIPLDPLTRKRMEDIALREFAPRMGGKKEPRPETQAARNRAMAAKWFSALWGAVERNHGHPCCICGQDMLHRWYAVLDHVKALGEGGADAVYNLVPVHAACNTHKGRYTPDHVRGLASRQGVPLDLERANQALADALAVGAQVPPDWLEGDAVIGG